jgi:hypothetical protein
MSAFPTDSRLYGCIGRGVIAQWIHSVSGRCSSPFVRTVFPEVVMSSHEHPFRVACWPAPTLTRIAPLTSLLGLLVFACADPVTAPRETAPSPPQQSLLSDSNNVTAALTTTDFLWASGQGPIAMGSTTGRVCFLARVGGNFTSTRYVRVYSSGGSWWLHGSSVGVSARARCSTAYSYTGEFAWAQGMNPTNMGSIYGRSCYLTRVGGNFEGNGERVEVFSGTTANWFLGGSSVHSGVHARARCVVYAWFMPKQPYTYSGWISSSMPQAILRPTTWACYLAGMRGDFEGSSSYVYVLASGGSWYAKASSQVLPTGIKAGCTSL